MARPVIRPSAFVVHAGSRFATVSAIALLLWSGASHADPPPQPTAPRTTTPPKTAPAKAAPTTAPPSVPTAEPATDPPTAPTTEPAPSTEPATEPPPPPPPKPPTHDAPDPPAKSGPRPLSVTISGGGTKGAYMAGQLYYLQERLKHGNGSLDPRVFTGASAGAINSVAAVLSQCGKPTESPQDSLFWAVWTPVGLNDLFDKDNHDSGGLFTRAGFAPAIAALEHAWNAGLPRSCDVLLGIAVTRMNGRVVQLAPDFPSLTKSHETVLLRVTGQGLGRPPRLRNHIDPKELLPQLLLPLDQNPAPFDSLRELVFASSSFPIGFAPVELAHCMSEPGKPAICTPKTARKEPFIDGGVFDNQPLGLSVRAMRHVVRNAAGGLAISDRRAESFLPESQFLYVDPRVGNLPQPHNKGGKQSVDSAMDVLTQMFGMAESVQSAELLNVFQREPGIRKRLLMTSRHLPYVSGTFDGLLERSFREFDFYLGMVDAARSRRFAQPGVHPEQLHLRSADVALRRRWQPFMCLRAIFDGVGKPKTLCQGEELKDLRILARATLDRLRDMCLEASMTRGDCRPSRFNRAVVGVTTLPDDERRRADGENGLDFLLRLLGKYRFHFRDMGLRREDAEDAPFRLARIAQDMVFRLTSSQPTNSLPLSVLGRIGVDIGVGYVPPQHIFHVSLGSGAEVGYSLGIDDSDWTWLRFTASLEMDGFSTLLNESDNYVGFRPKLGLEFEPIGTSLVQLRLGVRGGYQFSTADTFMTDPCNFATEESLPCSRFVTDAYVATSLLGLIRIHVAGSYMPGLRDGQPSRFAVRPMLGLQLNSPF